MLLKDIDLDMPYVEYKEKINEIIKSKKFTIEEAVRFDYEENWKKKRMKFRDEVQCITELYKYHLGKYRTKETTKLIINCVEMGQCTNIENVDGFTEVYVPFNYNHYTSLSNHEKKVLILECIWKGICLVSQELNWDVKPFDYAYKKVVEVNYTNEYVWEQKANRTKQLIAEIWCKHDIETYDIYMVVKQYGSNEEVKRVLLQTERPNGFAFTRHLGKLRWRSNNEVVLISKSNAQEWSVAIDFI
ncbi:hypothetical protein MUG87_15370 [Ectobacillus sp. JY-23]|uniref:hypothetical protein n=1 Tax=Ectobacillus sp. JY-23 TaxID=2933872 RepID=UPI001FF6FB4C|nr:hypothetical protein [Ectobacillus sp. JY-23]UOY91836.1 hypothetical protein MUG87_15370 [Ectobacillus sp. JY-23]